MLFLEVLLLVPLVVLTAKVVYFDHLTVVDAEKFRELSLVISIERFNTGRWVSTGDAANARKLVPSHQEALQTVRPSIRQYVLGGH